MSSASQTARPVTASTASWIADSQSAVLVASSFAFCLRRLTPRFGRCVEQPVALRVRSPVALKLPASMSNGVVTTQKNVRSLAAVFTRTPIAVLT